MPVLTGNVTYLGLTAGPWRAPGSFDAKDPAAADARGVVDTYLARVTLGDVSEVAVDLTDAYRLTLTMSALAGLGKSVSDAYTPVVTMGVASIAKSPTLGYAVADPLVPVLTMTIPAGGLVVGRSAADSLVPVITMTVTNSSSDAVVISDTLIPVIGMSYLLVAEEAARAWSASDAYVAALELAVTLRPSGDVDRITLTDRPYGRIRIVET